MTYQKYGGETSKSIIRNIEPSEEFGEGYVHAHCELRGETTDAKD